jgi:hypothetical protein
MEELSALCSWLRMGLTPVRRSLKGEATRLPGNRASPTLSVRSPLQLAADHSTGGSSVDRAGSLTLYPRPYWFRSPSLPSGSKLARQSACRHGGRKRLDIARPRSQAESGTFASGRRISTYGGAQCQENLSREILAGASRISRAYEGAARSTFVGPRLASRVQSTASRLRFACRSIVRCNPDFGADSQS